MEKDINILMIFQSILLRRNTFLKTSEEESTTVHPIRGLRVRLRSGWNIGGKRREIKKKVEV